MKLHVTFDTGHPARLAGLDAAVAGVSADDQPLRGLAARADWRLNGFLSRLVLGERFRGAPGEWLLIPTQGRLPFSHLFLVGTGRRDEGDVKTALQTLEVVAGKVASAGLHAIALDLSELVPAERGLDTAMVRFLEALSAAFPADVASDPPYRPAVEARARNKARMAEGKALADAAAAERTAWQARAEARRAAGEEPEPEPFAPTAPALEPEPERTVQVVFLGDRGTVASLRQALRDLGKGGSKLDVEWSR